jgi:DNA adenine methylase
MVGNDGSETHVVKPLLKWVGGKTQSITEVVSMFPREIHHYHEPFVGGGSVLLAMLSRIKAGDIKVLGKIYASDLNPNLIALYKNVQSAPDALFREAKTLATEFSEYTGEDKARYYYQIRTKFNQLTPADRASPTGSAMLIFMNKTCFRGLYREGPHGFNVPYGHYANPSIVQEEHIWAVSELIQDVVFTSCSFQESLARVVPGDFVYLDPPYVPVSKTESFVSYTSDGFSDDEHTTLFSHCRNLVHKNVHMLLSNSDAKRVKDAFPQPVYQTKIIACKRAIHPKKPGSKANEVLISNYI